MTPSARIDATIEILTNIEGSGAPANKVIESYYRSRRYIGSKDRHSISQRIFDILRHHGRLLWWTKERSPRLTTIASLALLDCISDTEITALFNNNDYSPEPLSTSELVFLEKLKHRSINNPKMPDCVRNEVPEWLAGKLKSKWSKNFEEEAGALNQPAPLDLRVNTLKSTRDEALQILEGEGINSTPTPFSPIGLRICQRVNLKGSKAFRDGYVEIQDEGSQLIALLVGAEANMTTIDLCAGSGGKTLALAASIKDGGRLIACEIDPSKLKKALSRFKRAGVSNVTRKVITGPYDPWIAAVAGSGDRVLLDVPCSGSGVWRRSPETKWKLTPASLSRYMEQQALILENGSKLVKVGGQIIYATCSILKQENEDQIEKFLTKHANYHLLPISNIWAHELGSKAPTSNLFLNLTPAQHYTDGFFCAVIKKVA